MADFITNQEELERLSKEAQQAQIEKSAANDRLSQGMRIGAILGLPRSANKSEIMLGMQPNNAGAQAVQQAWERPAALEAQSAEQRYKDILDRYKQGQTGILKSRELEQEKGKLTETERHNKAMEFAALSKGGEKDQKSIDKWAENLSHDLDPNKSRTGNFAIPAKMKMASERILGLFDQFPDGNIPKTQTVELATAVAGLISGGTSPQSQQQINELVPSSMRGNSADIAAWITNDPKGRGQQKFMELLKGTAKREAEIADKQIEKIRASRLPLYNKLRKTDPETYNQIVSGYGLDPKYIDEAGMYNKPKDIINLEQAGQAPNIANSGGFNLINNAGAASPGKSREQMIADIKAKMAGGK